MLIKRLGTDIHPDELLQGPEVAAQLFCGVKARLPWEFEGEHACRSVLVP